MRPSIRGAALVAAAAALVIGAAGSAPKRGSIKWLSSFERAQAQAKKTKRIMMVDFYADW